MKKILILTLCMVTLTISCTKQVQVIDEPLVPITLGGGASIDTKAPITAATFVAQVIALNNKTFETAGTGETQSSNYVTDLYKDQTNATTPFDKVVTFTSGTGVIDGTAVYYPTKTAIKVYFKGYYPADVAVSGTNFAVVRNKTGESVDGRSVTFSNVKGYQDIMVSTQNSGNRATTTPIELNFNHLLSQIIFKVKAADDAAIDVWGKITKIEVLNQVNNFTLDLSIIHSGAALTANATTATFTAYTNETGQALTTSAANIGAAADNNGILMVNPTTANWTIKVYSINSPDGLEVTNSFDLVKGSAHEITLTFQANAIAVSATVTDWVDGTDYNQNIK